VVNGLRITSDGYIQAIGSAGVRIKNPGGTAGQTILFADTISTNVFNGNGAVIDGDIYVETLIANTDFSVSTTSTNPSLSSIYLYRKLNSVGQNPRFQIFYKLEGEANTPAQIASFNINNLANGLTLSNCTAIPPSDKRLKSIIDQNVDFLNIIKQIEPVKFKWKNDINNIEYMGFLAQDLLNIIPQAVYVGDEEDPIVDEQNATVSVKQNWGIDYGYLVTYLVGAIQELSAKVDELESRLV
jgi:hypothetical protein